jgi:quaternary ammonium compound-resistance protein SugE
MEWFYLAIAGLLEMFWAIGLKYSQGFTKPLPSIMTVLGMAASFYFLSLSLKSLPIGTAYAVWTGIGTVGTVMFGIVLFAEPVGFMRLACIMLVVSGIIGLKITI